jgi:hypothetical protein
MGVSHKQVIMLATSRKTARIHWYREMQLIFVAGSLSLVETKGIGVILKKTRVRRETLQEKGQLNL